MTENAPLVLLGHIRDAFGIHGWVKIVPHSNDPQALLQVKDWILEENLHPERKQQTREQQASQPNLALVKRVEVLEIKQHTDHIVARFKDCTTRTQAEQLKSHQIWISRENFPELEEDEHYWIDLIGMKVINQQQEHLGVVTHLSDNGAHDILHLTSETGDTEKPTVRMIPYVDAYVLEIDEDARTIHVDWGLDY